MSTSKQSAGGRLRVITIDQLVSGASNVLIAVLAARLLGVASFGLFGIVFLVYTIAIGVTRALVSEPLLVHPEEAKQRRGEVIGSIALLSLGLTVLLIIVGLVARIFNASLGDSLLVLAVCLPLLVLQDLGRYLSFATQTPGFAVVLDAVWLIAMLGGVAVLFARDGRTLASFIAAWAGSGAAAGVLLFARYPLRGVRLGFSWLRYTWGFSWRYLMAYTSTQGAQLGASSGLGAIAGGRALGAVNGGLLLTRPFTTFQSASMAAGIGEIRRSATATEGRRHVARTAWLTTAVAVLNGLVIVTLPTKLGEVVLGAGTWHAARPIMLAVGVQIVCMGLMTGARAGLVGMRRIREATTIDVVSSIALVAVSIGGALIGGLVGCMWALAVGRALFLIPWWVTFTTRGRRSELFQTPAAPLSAVPAAGTRH